MSAAVGIVVGLVALTAYCMPGPAGTMVRRAVRAFRMIR